MGASLRRYAPDFQLNRYELKKWIWMISLMNLTVDTTIEG